MSIFILSACGGGGSGGGSPDNSPDINLSRIEVTPTMPMLANGTSLELTATGIYSDSSRRSLTGEVTWSSSNDSFANVSNNGGVSTLAPGTVTLQASLSGITGSTDLTVTNATLTQLEISPGSAALAMGSSLSISLIARYSDNSTQTVGSSVNLSVTDTDIATLSTPSPDSGERQLTGLAEGSTQLIASLGAISTQITVTVSKAELVLLSISPDAPSLALGTTVNVTAQGQYGDGSTQTLTSQVNWTSADTGIFTVDASGLITPQSPGSAVLTASLVGIITTQTVIINSANLTSIDVTADTTSLPVGEQLSLVALGRYSDGSLQDISEQVTWLSNPVDRLAISNANGSQGLATALETGALTATAILGEVSGQLALTINAITLLSIEISPPNTRLAAGTATRYLAIGHYSDGSIQDISEQTSWSSSNSALATTSNAVENRGLTQAISTGNLTITTTLGAVSGNTSLTVTAAQLLSINVLPSELSLAAGARQNLQAEGSFSDGSVQDLDGQVVWASDTPEVASVSNGALTALLPGNTRVSASLSGISGNASITVTTATLSSIQISPANPSLAAGTNLQLQATALYSNGSQEDVTTRVTWSSADNARLRVENSTERQGRLSALAMGSIVVTASLSDATGTVSDSISASVTDANLTGLRILSSKTSLDSAEQIQLTAMGDFSDGSSQDLTADTVWSSNLQALAFVSNHAMSQGLLEAVIGISGTVTITANYGGFNPALDFAINNTPQRPISLVLLATPNVIRNDGVDSTTLEVRVQAADPSATVADGTVVNLQISQAGNVLSSESLVTSGGVASTFYSTTQTGLLQLQATIDTTTISNNTTLYTADNIYDVIALGAFADAQTSGTTILSGGRFGFFLYNLSNRDFPLLQFELKNGADILLTTSSPIDLNGNVLAGGLQMGIIVTLSTDITDQGIEARYFLTDPATGNPVTASVIFSAP
ncbi:MAG: Ig-like domain-containing protein [Ectothiorhodospiraceae bacterium]|nr:Ig-like domain-containing protein [Ectothiorhodospiraceae bacterium]